MSKCSVVCEMGLLSPDPFSARGDGDIPIDSDGSLAARAAGVDFGIDFGIDCGIDCVVVVDGFTSCQS